MTDTLMVGVSGVRGIVGKDLTAEVVTQWARGFGLWLHEGTSAGGPGPGTSVVIGRDARTSGPMFAAAVTAGLTSVGCDVIDIGLVPTPTVQLGWRSWPPDLPEAGNRKPSRTPSRSRER